MHACVLINAHAVDDAIAIVHACVTIIDVIGNKNASWEIRTCFRRPWACCCNLEIKYLECVCWPRLGSTATCPCTHWRPWCHLHAPIAMPREQMFGLMFGPLVQMLQCLQPMWRTAVSPANLFCVMHCGTCMLPFWADTVWAMENEKVQCVFYLYWSFWLHAAELSWLQRCVFVAVACLIGLTKHFNMT
jgi:hypothetical protein